ncbi:MAG: hypothetical protein GY855_17955 [candidate division Zixibacteria bacterium]|nr:hypothetical protein [candidate division Zixibacteria bacterium]
MKAGLVIGIVLLVSGIIYAPQLNAQECEGYTDPSSATLDFVSFNPNNGKLVLRLNYCCTRHTSKDRCPITSSIAGECDTSSIWYMVHGI